MTGKTKAWIGQFGEIGHPYTHPSSKQCGYSYTHPSTKQCNYSYTHPSTKQCDAAAGNHDHNLNNLSGTLAVSKGGTGVTSLDALKSALGITTGGCKMYYGTFTMYKTNLVCTPGFTPYIILIGQYGNNKYTYMNRVIGFSIKGQPIVTFFKYTSKADGFGLDVSWSSSSVTVESNNNFMNSDIAYIVLGQ